MSWFLVVLYDHFQIYFSRDSCTHALQFPFLAFVIVRYQYSWFLMKNFSFDHLSICPNIIWYNQYQLDSCFHHLHVHLLIPFLSIFWYSFFLYFLFMKSHLYSLFQIVAIQNSNHLFHQTWSLIFYQLFLSIFCLFHFNAFQISAPQYQFLLNQ